MKQEKIYKIHYLLPKVLAFLLLLTVGLIAQNTAPTPSPDDGSTTYGGYDIKSSVEIGVRGLKVDGSENKFRSDLNYRNGVRLFDSSFLATAKDGDGKPFTSLLVTTSGWGADRSGYTRVNMEKLGWYNFDASVRRFAYFNNLSNIALGQHTRNTNRTTGDFDLTILPQNETIKFRVGYSFNRQKGPGSLTYDYDRDEFPILMDLDSNANDLRVGFDAKVAGFNLTFTQGFRRFTDNSSFSIDSPQLG
ncbi:MAG: hypothetical protein KDB79_12285, partial [Acidobacteria bacterium]|nr:hypothetical protein [Acidobacteriota bacterium]